MKPKNWKLISSEQDILSIIQRTNQSDYVEFILGEDGSYSNVGRIGGRQYIHLDSRWATRGTVMHELGHAVGLIHEHQCFIYHDNPNSNLIFKWDNIKKDAKKNYSKYGQSHDGYNAGLDDPNFPINSLMIYGSYTNDFAIDNSKPVLVFKKWGFIETTYYAQRSYLSVSDRLAVAKKYGYSYDPATDPNRPPI